MQTRRGTGQHSDAIFFEALYCSNVGAVFKAVSAEAFPCISMHILQVQGEDMAWRNKRKPQNIWKKKWGKVYKPDHKGYEGSSLLNMLCQNTHLWHTITYRHS